MTNKMLTVGLFDYDKTAIRSNGFALDVGQTTNNSAGIHRLPVFGTSEVKITGHKLYLSTTRQGACNETIATAQWTTHEAVEGGLVRHLAEGTMKVRAFDVHSYLYLSISLSMRLLFVLG